MRRKSEGKTISPTAVYRLMPLQNLQVEAAVSDVLTKILPGVAPGSRNRICLYSIRGINYHTEE